MAVLTRDQIITARNAQIQQVRIDALGGDVLLRVVSLRDSEEFRQKNVGLSGIDSTKLHVSYVLSNPDGTRMFTDSEEDMNDLNELGTNALLEIAKKGNELNGIKEGEVEETAKK